MGDLAERMAAVRYPGLLRGQQVAALAALDGAWASGRSRALVVLPPGAGKTVVGLEAARRLGRPVVALAPNTAIQGQWVRAWRRFGPPLARAGTDRDLSADVTALTYQALATFSPDDEVDEDGERAPARPALSLLDRLHVNGRALVRALAEAGPLTLVLDECHHLLEVWGQLLAELLDLLPDARVIGLTATPPSSLTAEQAALVARLFGEAVHTTSLPAAVRDGDLAPFAELARFVPPTPAERDWLAEESERFTELTTDLLDPAFAPVGFLDWVDARFVRRDVAGPLGRAPSTGPGSATPGSAAAPGSATGPGCPPALPWQQVERDDPELATAALRLHAAGLLALPPGARLREEHRSGPTPRDWVRLVDDYARGCLLPADDDHSREAFDRLRAALPSVGWTLTRRGARPTRTPVDRVVARSEAKSTAAVEVVAAEHAALGDRLRAVVLTDHERATSTLPARLVGVLPPQAGSARLLLDRLVADPATAALGPVLVTGRTVAAGVATARALVAFVEARAPRLRLDPVPPEEAWDGRWHDEGVVEVTGDWGPREWVAHVTAWFEAGHSRVLVGTRGLLGEGWDARGVNVVVDLTTAATPTAVVQTRGRGLRVDPAWPEKVTDVWSVVCVAEGHPGALSDWDRFVRKHEGLLALDADGEITDGVAHVHPELAPHAPPPPADLARIDAELLARAGDRAATRAGWRVGTPYDDEVVPSVRVRPGHGRVSGAASRAPGAAPPTPPDVLPAARGFWRADTVPDPRRGSPLGWLALVAGAAVPLVLGVPEASVPAGIAAAAPVQWTRSTLAAGRLARRAAQPPDVLALGCAVADGLRDAGLVPVGAEAVAARVDAGGAHRLVLDGAGARAAAAFATSLEEVLSPVGDPRYLVPRWVPDPVGQSRAELRRAGRAWLARRGRENVVVHHAVPTLLGQNARRARAFAAAWTRWVSAGAEPVFTRSPEGAGVLAACRGLDPLDLTAGLRSTWR